MHQDGVGVSFPHPLYRGVASVRRTVVHHPEHPAAHVRASIRSPVFGVLHYLLDQASERFDAGLGFAAAHDPPLLNVPGRQVLQRPTPLVLRGHSAASSRSGLQRWVFANACLDTGLLVAADNPVERVESLVLPVALVEVQHHSSLGKEVRRAREEPVLVLPGLDGVLVKDLPYRGAANGLAQFLLRSLGQVGGRLAAQGLPVRATTSQAMDTTTALSRGGKDGLAASSCSVFQGKVTFGPALSPTADAVGVKVEPGSNSNIGKRGVFVEDQNQMRSLPKVRRRRASCCKASGLSEELIGKTRAIVWGWSRHVSAPQGEQS